MSIKSTLAAAAANVDLIDMIVYLIISHGHKNNPADDSLPDMGNFFTSTQGYDLSIPLYDLFIIT